MTPGRRPGLNGMTKLTMQITMSLDGFVAGPNANLENPLGEGAEHLHDWLVSLAVFHETHGVPGQGERGPDDDLVRAEIASRGATIMGRRMFSGGSGVWEGDP